jgi:hypothetical protein
VTTRRRAAPALAAGIAIALAAPLLPASLAGQGAQPRGAERAPSPLDRAWWLAGCWEGASGGRPVEERWSAPRGGTMVATARAFRGDSTTTIELTILRVRDGVLAYEAVPVGQTHTIFPATAVTDSSLVFANPEHDFPQRITYRRVGADSLAARVEGPSRGAWRALDYALRRVPCEPGGRARP